MYTYSNNYHYYQEYKQKTNRKVQTLKKHEGGINNGQSRDTGNIGYEWWFFTHIGYSL